MTSKIVTCMISCLVSTATAGAAEMLWYQPNNSNWTTVPSVVTTAPPENTEAADDFDLVGSIERVVIDGYGCFQCAKPTVSGVYVRFYEYTDNGPGVLQAEYFLGSDDPAFLYDADLPEDLDITLPEPFEATGKHFLSTQLVIEGFGYWSWWISNYNTPQGAALYYRDNLAGQDWGSFKDGLGQVVIADLAFQLWGTDSSPPDSGTDPCGTWIVVDSPNPEDTIHTKLNDVLAFDSDDVWAVGDALIEVQYLQYENQTLAMHFDGQSWSIVPTPSPTPYPGGGWCELNAIAAVTPTEMYAAGTQRIPDDIGYLGQQLLVLNWDGYEWSVMDGTPITTSASGSVIRDIVLFATDDIWFVGDWIDVDPQGYATFMGLAMHYDGNEFTVFDTPVPDFGGTPGFGLEAADGVAPNDIWAVGGGSDGDYTGGSYIIHWDGSTWTHADIDLPGVFNRLYDVAAIAADNVWAVGDYFDGTGYFHLLLHWDGSEWTQIDEPAGSTSLLTFGPDNIYTGGGGIYHFDGETWSLVEDFDQLFAANTWAMTASDTCELWAVGSQTEVGELTTFTARIDLSTPPTCEGDANGDNVVDPLDSGYVLARFGCEVGTGDADCDAADANTDGVVDPLDVGFVLARFGDCP